MKLGKKALEALQAEIDGILKPGDELIVAGAVAAEGTAWLTENRHEKLREFFAERFLEDARKTSGDIWKPEGWKKTIKSGKWRKKLVPVPDTLWAKVDFLPHSGRWLRLPG